MRWLCLKPYYPRLNRRQLKTLMKQDFELQAKRNSYMWYQRRRQLTIMYRLNANHYSKYNVDGLVYFEVCPDIMTAISRE